MRDGRPTRFPIDGLLNGLAAAALASAILPAAAQTATAPAPLAKDAAPSERAQRDADKVFHWIMIQGDRARKTPKDGPKDVAKDSLAKDDRTTAAARPVRAATVKPAAADADTPARTRTADALAVPTSAQAEPAAALASNDPRVSAPASAPVQSDAGAASPKIDNVEPPPASTPAPSGMAEPPRADPTDVALVPVAQVQPQFSINVMRTLRRGTVEVRFTVRPDGSVGDVEVLSSTSVKLNAAAVAAMSQWRFQPIAREQSGAIQLGFDLD